MIFIQSSIFARFHSGVKMDEVAVNDKEQKRKSFILAAVFIFIVIFFVILPSFTPEDLITTAPIIATIGIKNFLIVSGILILILLILLNQKETKEAIGVAIQKLKGKQNA